MSRVGLEPTTIGLKVQTLQIPALTELRVCHQKPLHTGLGQICLSFSVPLRLTRRVLSVFIAGRRILVLITTRAPLPIGNESRQS